MADSAVHIYRMMVVPSSERDLFLLSVKNRDSKSLPTTMSDRTLAIPKGAWVLVTGITGFLASHVTKQLLDRGYKIRGTTRDLSSATRVTDEMFPDASRSGNLELVALDFAASSCDDDDTYNAAVKGVHGIVHIATIQTFDPDPSNVIPPVINSVTALVKAAAREPTVKRFVYTSSSVASFVPDFFSNETTLVGRDSWNDAAVAAAKAPPPPPYTNAFQGAIVYMASKVEAEKTFWKLAADEKPQFQVNVVSPYTLVGPVLHKSYKTKNLPGWINQLYHGNTDFIENIPARESRPPYNNIPHESADVLRSLTSPVCYVNVKDVALIHVAALLDGDLRNERIQAWCTPFNWNDILAMWRKQYPERKFIEDLPNMGRVNARIDDSLPKSILKKWAGQEDWISLTDGFCETIDSVLADESD